MSNPSEPNDPVASITVSIVSHKHGQQVEMLVKQVLADPLISRLVLTLNTEEMLNLPQDDRLLLLQNATPKGFGTNHNQAFTHCETPYFCVLNPDIVLRDDTFTHLLGCLNETRAAVAGPLVLSPLGEQEDSWRRFPTIFSLVLKALGHDMTIMKQADKEFPLFPDWIAGMCMLFDSKHYQAINGFDESLFLYYEDVDICARLWLKNLAVVASSKAVVVHNAQRASRREWQHMKWHARSMAKYLRRYSLRMPKANRHFVADQ
ncbi:glycosyltransferase family 2 protein [Orrella daihaiensis]|uniref:Glycosyltransferase family 2 protein n=1 Tax=Orrella daihaiensis TaxID=2782176 RepID=A0ABY4ANW0_9BURK|nr:glycosyltransferase [Orrella daihaiensis]UOD49729.1 glycosyltransferase family 2 protein [Orrella daihaiensis]